MAVQVKLVDMRYRLVEEGTDKIAINKNGKPLDGGGHKDAFKAIRQASYINVATEPETRWEDQKKK